MRRLNSLNFAVKFFLLIIFSTNLSVSQPLIEWEKIYGGSDTDFANSAIQTSDGGYIIAGETWSNDGDISINKGESDIWVVKLNSKGEIEWEKSYGGTNFDEANSIIQSQNGGYLIGGSATSNNGDISNPDSNKNGWILKLNTQGDIEWEKKYGGIFHSTNFMKQLPNGDYIAVGTSWPNDDNNCSGQNGWLLKLKKDGDILWEKCYEGQSFNAVDLTLDGGYILVGLSEPVDGNPSGGINFFDYWIVKLDSLGDIEWEKNYGGTRVEIANDVLQESDGSYILVGYTLSNDGDVLQNNGSFDSWILKLNQQGEIIWQKSFGGSNTDDAYSLEKADDGGYLVAGCTDSTDGDVSGNRESKDFWLIKLDSLGNLIWESTYGTNSNDFLNNFSKTSDGGYILPGITWDPILERFDLLIIKLAPVMVNIEQPDYDFDINIFPNPSFGELHIDVNNLLEPFSVEVYNTTGKKVFKKKEVTSPITLNNLPSGQYLVNVKTFERNSIKKITLY